MPSQPQQCFDSGCPLAGKSKGFALGSGDPKSAKMAVLLETPGGTEIGYLTKELADGVQELQRRSVRYPKFAGTRFVNLGAPVVGPSGNELFNWALKSLGLQRSDLFIENVLHCLPEKGKTGANYPIGNERKKAEGCCLSLWNRLDEFAPTAAVVNFHPAAILRDVTPLPIQIRAFEKAKRLMLDGHRVVVCCGGKAAAAWFGYADNVTRWAIHHQMESTWTRQRRAARWAANKELNVMKEIRTKKPKKMTPKHLVELVLLHSTMVQLETGGIVWRFDFTNEVKEILTALLQPKPRVKKTDAINVAG